MKKTIYERFMRTRVKKKNKNINLKINLVLLTIAWFQRIFLLFSF